MEQTTYHGFTIKTNEYGFFNVAAINCWSTPTLQNAKNAIDRYASAANLCEHGVPKSSRIHCQECEACSQHLASMVQHTLQL